MGERKRIRERNDRGPKINNGERDRIRLKRVKSNRNKVGKERKKKGN
jgi:hypothetical protein